MNTERGISADEACRTHALTNEDFASMCNQDGSLKNQPHTTTFNLRDDPSKTVTIDNSVLYAFAAVLILVMACTVVLLIRQRAKRKLWASLPATKPIKARGKKANDL